MCSVCGCGGHEPEIKVHGGSRDSHPHPHHQHATNDLQREVSPTSGTSHEAMPSRLVAIERDILAENDLYARANRQRLQRSGVLALNLVSSPGSGKTTLLVETIRALAPEMLVAVIEGDQQTTRDVERIRATGTRALQINTGKGCHLDAHVVGHALEVLEPPGGGVLFIENVGNLVCPAGFDLGEAHKVVLLSVTEGEDKPLKYADMFAVADLMILNKCDLLPHLDFDLGRCVEYARRVNPGIEVVQLSACSGKGMSAWLDWVRERRVAAAPKTGETIA